MEENNIPNEFINEQYKNFISKMANDLMRLNFSDMIEVVRCKNYRFYNGKSCTVRLDLFGFWLNVQEHEYCSRGERRCEECLNE